MSACRYPSATADVKDGLAVTYRKVQDTALFRIPVGLGILHVRRTVVTFVKVQVQYMAVQPTIIHRLLIKVNHFKIFKDAFWKYI